MSPAGRVSISSPYAFQHSPSRLLLEVVDKSNTPVCLLHAASVLRQGLPHRAVALLLRDKNSRALLTFWPELGWGFSAYARVPAGQAFEDCARDLLRADGWTPPAAYCPWAWLRPARKAATPL